MYLVFGTSEKDPYDRDALIATYELHNSSVKRYFAQRSDDLLVVDLSEERAAQRVIEFLGMTYQGQQLPRLNQSAKPTRAYAARAHRALIAEHDELLRSYQALRAERDDLAVARDTLAVERDALAAMRDALIAERGALAATRDALTVERDVLARAEAGLLAQREALARRNDELTAAHDTLVATNDDLIRASHDLIAECSQTASARDAAISERDALLGSSSWRVTAPLRKVRHFLAPRTPD
jgi:hypothetical protein